MKRWIAALAAALLLLTLAACQKNEPAPEQPEAPPAIETPDAPETPEAPDAPDDAPETPAPPAPAPEDGTAEVTEALSEGSVEEVVSYQLRMPKIAAADETVSRILNDYYGTVYGKLDDLAWGEAYEQALEDHAVYHLEAGFQVMRNDGNVLSIYRTVTLTNRQTGVAEVTASAETFNLKNGGLLTAGDFFAAGEDVYAARLADCVRRQIGEDPYHDQNYFAQWEDLALAAFSKDQFYVTDDSYCVFYQENDLGGAAETVFEIPWSQLEDLLA